MIKTDRQKEILQLEALIYTTVRAISEIDHALYLYKRLPITKKNSDTLEQIKIQKSTIIEHLQIIENYCAKIRDMGPDNGANEKDFKEITAPSERK